MLIVRYLCAVISLSDTMKERKGKSSKAGSTGRPAAGKRTSPAGKASPGRRTSSEGKSAGDRRSQSEDRPESGRRTSSGERSSYGRSGYAEGRPTEGKRPSRDSKSGPKRRDDRDQSRGGRSSASKGRAGRTSPDNSREESKVFKPLRETRVDPRHTRGAVKSIKKSDPESDKKSEKRSEYRDRSRDERYSRTGSFKKEETVFKPAKKDDGTIRLNKFLSNAGIASRREADRLIELGLVTVNGKAVTELGHKVDPSKDIVKYDDVALRPERYRYVLLNKPKDYITTMDDPDGRKTVMFLVREACKERIYPVGRLDRNTTGLLLFTNDGELAKRLTHPKNGYAKLYHVETVEKVNPRHLEELRTGITLEDGPIVADDVSYVNDDPRQVGIRIHSGKNRIVRRIFEHYNYTIKKLDRVMFAGLTKKDLPRGRFRHLSEQEINFLKMIR